MSAIVPGLSPPAAAPHSIYVLHFDVVHGCQLRCVGCPNSTLLPKVSLIEPDFFEHCLRQIDVERIHTFRLFNFGEPLLHKRLSEVVARIPKQRWSVVDVEISTNAQKVYWDDFERTLAQRVLTRIVVSADGDGSPEDYERLRPPSQWSRLIEFLERTKTLVDRHCPGIELICVSVSEQPEHRERWKQTLVPRGWTPRFRRWMRLPQSARDMTGRPLHVPNSTCFFLAHWSQFHARDWDGQVNLLYVDADGSVVPCCMHPGAGHFGNLSEQPFSAILQGSKRAGFIETMRRERAAMPVCGQCDVGPVGDEGPSFWAAIDA
jgi:radical SAM protein with 4Fe4S-binding SPASM domain